MNSSRVTKPTVSFLNADSSVCGRLHALNDGQCAAAVPTAGCAPHLCGGTSKLLQPGSLNFIPGLLMQILILLLLFFSLLFLSPDALLVL
jgi:hypothetical protein